MLLIGKTAVVTGCLQGIGLATLNLMAANGANVFACCQKQTPEIEGHMGRLSDHYGVDIVPVYFDLLDEQAIKAAASTIQKAKKPIDILVNVAGANFDALFHMISMEQMQKTFQINFFSPMLFTQYITRLMLKNGAGSVINVSSISAIDGNPGQLSYASSKAAMLAATTTLSAELAPKGIRVNAIAPGVIDTDMTKDLPDDVMERQMILSDLKRVGTPEEVASLIVFLASDKSNFITGQIIRVDGGIG